MPTTCVVTLGHDGLSVPVFQARDTIRDTIRAVGADTLCEALDGWGTWEDQVETCDVWVLSIPDGVHLPSLAVFLASDARTLGQEAIGLIVHDHASRPQSYVLANGADQ